MATNLFYFKKEEIWWFIYPTKMSETIRIKSLYIGEIIKLCNFY